MNSFNYQLLFCLLIHIKNGSNYPTGAPNTVCGSMLPGHGVSSQQCSSKYTIQSDKSQYYTNDTVLITVSGTTISDTFRGILLVAKTQTTGQIIGTWSVVSSSTKIVDCNNVVNTGITHTSNSDKSSIEALWYPPSTFSDPTTIIRATVVTTYSQIYVNCFSITLMARQSNQSTNGPIITTPATNSSITLSSSTLITTTIPPTSNVGVNITWTYTNGVTAVTMRITNLQTSQWLALGLSLDQSMGNDHVFVCKHLADNTVSVERDINPGGHSPPVPASTVNNPGGTFTITSQRLEDGVAYCEFTLSGFPLGKRRRRDVSSLSPSISYYPLIAVGNLDSSNGLIQHTARTALSQQVELNEPETILYNLDSSSSDQTALMKAHGIIMIFAWILFVSTGILLARYFKTSWPNRKICGKPIWFAVHRALMSTVAVLTIIAFILILVYEKGTWIPQREKAVFTHSIIGILVIIFSVIQPIMALFRCKPDADYRFIFNYVHAIVGLTAFILSIVAIFITMFFRDFNFAINKVWGIVVAWICWLFIIFFIFWLIEFYFHKQSTKVNNIESYDLDDTNISVQNDPIKVANNVKKDRIKGIFLLIHILVALVLTLTLSILVGKA